MAGKSLRGEFSSSSEVAQRMEKDSEAGHTGDSVEVELDERGGLRWRFVGGHGEG